MSEHGKLKPEPPNPLREAVRAVYAELDSEIAAVAPVCQISGRCCRFREYGHTLFLSTTELALLLDEAPPPVRPLDSGDTCPWQDDRGHCSARDARPLSCRVYFCDPAFQDQLPRIGESFTSRLKQLVETHGGSWHYAPLHYHLRIARDAGQYVDPPSRPPLEIPRETQPQDPRPAPPRVLGS